MRIAPVGQFDFRPRKTVEKLGRGHFEEAGVILVLTDDSVEGSGSYSLEEDGRIYCRWFVWTGDVAGAMKTELERLTGNTLYWKRDIPPPGVVFQGQGRGSAFLSPEVSNGC